MWTFRLTAPSDNSKIRRNRFLFAGSSCVGAIAGQDLTTPTQHIFLSGDCIPTYDKTLPYRFEKTESGQIEGDFAGKLRVEC